MNNYNSKKVMIVIICLNHETKSELNHFSKRASGDITYCQRHSVRMAALCKQQHRPLLTHQPAASSQVLSLENLIKQKHMAMTWEFI